MNKDEVADLTRRLVDTILPLNEKYQRLLEFVESISAQMCSAELIYHCISCEAKILLK